MPGEPVSQKILPPRFDGVFYFGCCGVENKIEGVGLGVVTCPRCNVSYDIHLVVRRRQVGRWPKGTKLRILEDVKVKAGSAFIILKKGEIGISGEDRFGILGTNEGLTLIEVESVGLTDKKRILLAAVTDKLLEEVKDNA